MKKCVAVAVFAFLVLAGTAVAQLTPGAVIQRGDPFPVVTDFNGDGLDDVVCDKKVIFNNGGAFRDERTFALAERETVMGVVDVNGDHIPDLLTVETSAEVPAVLPQGQRSGPLYRLYIADAARNYGAPIVITQGAQPYAADVDGDGKDDFLLMNDVRPDGVRSVATDVTVLRSRGDGTFEQLPSFRIGKMAGADRFRIETADLDHDGYPDLVIRCPEDLVILRGTGGGRFTVDDRYLPQTMDYGWWSMRVADIDGDGNPDIVLAGLRSVRVFFGDGRGNFPRTATASIAKLHDANVPQGLELLNVDGMNQPRDIAIGHFTRTDRNEIAAGTGEGDLVVIAWDGGKLQEVSRTRTDFWLLDVRSAKFTRSGLNDVYVMGTLIWGDMYPHPRIFNGNAIAAAGVSAATPVTRRRVGSRPAPLETTLQVQMTGECVDETASAFAFARDGIFGWAQNGTTSIAAVFDGNAIYVRVLAPNMAEPATAKLVPSNGVYTGIAQVNTSSCGWKNVTITAE